MRLASRHAQTRRTTLSILYDSSESFPFDELSLTEEARLVVLRDRGGVERERTFSRKSFGHASVATLLSTLRQREALSPSWRHTSYESSELPPTRLNSIHSQDLRPVRCARRVLIGLIFGVRWLSYQPLSVTICEYTSRLPSKIKLMDILGFLVRLCVCMCVCVCVCVCVRACVHVCT